MLTKFWIGVTALGSLTVLSLVTVALLVNLLVTEQPGLAVWTLATILVALGLSFGIKFVIHEPRPPGPSPIPMPTSPGFPSGHAAMSAVVYPVWSLVVGANNYWLATAIATSLLVGVSRWVLGVHYWQDIVAGWVIGFFIVWVCWALLLNLVAI